MKVARTCMAEKKVPFCSFLCCLLMGKSGCTLMCVTAASVLFNFIAMLSRILVVTSGEKFQDMFVLLNNTKLTLWLPSKFFCGFCFAISLISFQVSFLLCSPRVIVVHVDGPCMLTRGQDGSSRLV